MSPDDIARHMSEDIDDTDEFRNEEFWWRTFRDLIDEGGLELVAHALRTHFPSDRVLEVGENYVLMAVTLEAGSDDLRKLKIPFHLDSVLQAWLKLDFIPALQKAELEMQKGGISKDRHPLFFEDLSPWGNEMGKPWGWQVSAQLIAPSKPSGSGEGLDDTDEFLTGDESYLVTVTNKHYPGKEVSGIVGFKDDGHFPQLLSLDRNDWELVDDFARKLIWSAWWATDEAQHGEASYHAQDLDPGDMLQMDQGGIEMLKYYNDPEHYNNSKHPKSVYRKDPSPPGWGKVGTHTYGEAHETPFTKYVNGKIFTRIYEQDLMNLFMNTWYWTPPGGRGWTGRPRGKPSTGAPDTLYKSPDEIIDDYPLVFVHWAMPIEMDEFYGGNSPPPPPENVEPDSVDDRDEFDADDPEVDLQKWEDAEKLAAKAARERMLKEFATIDPGYELLYVGAKGTLDKKMKPYAVITRVAVTEDLDDKDEFRPQYARPVNVVGHAYKGYPDASLIYDFEDGARLYYMSSPDITKYILREPDGTVHPNPTFRSSQDAPGWFDPYYQGMMVANVHEKNDESREGMWARGPIQPFTPEQSREWSQMTGSPVMREALNDKDEFTKNYKLRAICGWCKKDLGFKPTSIAQDDGKISHDMCRDCEVKQYREMGMEPPPVTEDLDDKDEFVNDDDVCENCGEVIGFDNLAPAPESGDYVCNSCYIELDQAIVDDSCPYCHKVVGSENLIPSPNPNENVACRDCRNKIDKIDDKDEFMPADSDDICGMCDAVVGRENMVRRSSDPIYGDLAGIVCKQCKEKEDQGPQDDKWLESTDNISQSINEEITIDLAGFLNSRNIRPWTYAPGAGNSPRFSIRPGHEGECVDEESGLMDDAGRDVTKEYQMQHNIDVYIAPWTPPQKPRVTPPDDPTLLDDEDEFYTGETECVVIASLGKYSVDMDQAVFYNGRWQTLE